MSLSIVTTIVGQTAMGKKSKSSVVGDWRLFVADNVCMTIHSVTKGEAIERFKKTVPDTPYHILKVA